MAVVIANNRIDGLRITIYDVLHYLEAGRTAEEIEAILSLSREQIEAAMHYINEHRDDVMATYARIEERIARGNPPEIEAHARAGRARMDDVLRSTASSNGKEGKGERIAS